MRGLSFQCRLHSTNAGNHRRKTISGPVTQCHGHSRRLLLGQPHLPHNQRRVSRDVPDTQGRGSAQGTLRVSGAASPPRSCSLQPLIY